MNPADKLIRSFNNIFIVNEIVKPNVLEYEH